VRFDIQQGIKAFESISDHKTFPVSILVNREAFLVMFPELSEGVYFTVRDERARSLNTFCCSLFTEAHDPNGPTPEQLEELRASFFTLAAVSKSVVFARAQPAMKKKMVTEIQLRYCLSKNNSTL
jgi:hypothetical protein